MSIKKIWDKIFKEERVLSPIYEDMPRIVRIFKKNGVKKILDLGCGSGKYIVYLSEQKFDVRGIDISTEGLKKTRKRLKEKGIQAKLKVGSIYRKLPYKENFFDAVICIRTINHGRIESIRRAIKEIERVLKPNGFLFLTTRRRESKEKRHPFKVIAPYTCIPLAGREKGLVHYLFTKSSLKKEFNSFKSKIWFDKEKHYYCLLGQLRK